MRRTLTAWVMGLAILLPGIAAGQNGTVAPVAYPVYVDASGVICGGCLLYTYEAGTTNALDAFTDVTLLVAHANPIVLDAAGQASSPIFLSANSYKFVLKTAAEVTIRTADNVSATHASVTGVTNTGDLTFQVDSDNDGSNKFTFIDGTSVERFSITEAGVGQIDSNFTIGDATAADKALLFDGNAQDFHIGLDDSTDDLVIGSGSVLGTTPAISINEDQVVQFHQDPLFGGTTPTVAIGDAGEEDAALVFDGNAQDYHVGLDDSTDQLVIGRGTALGTTPAFSLTTAGAITLTGAVSMTSTLGVTGAITSAASVALTGTTNNLGTITTGVWNAGAVTSSGVLTVNGFGTHPFSAGGTGVNSLAIRNTTAGTGNYADLIIGNDTQTDTTTLRTHSSTYTPGIAGYDTADGTLFRNSTAGGLTIAASHASGTIRLFAGGTTRRMLINTTGIVTMDVYGAGTATFSAAGVISSVFDEREGTVLGPFSVGLNALLGVRPIRYQRHAGSGNDAENVYAGLSDQNVMQYIPEAIGKNLSGRYSMDIIPVVAATINAVQELTAEVDELRAAVGLAAKNRTMAPITDEARVVSSAKATIWPVIRWWKGLSVAKRDALEAEIGVTVASLDGRSADEILAQVKLLSAAKCQRLATATGATLPCQAEGVQ